MSYIIYNIESTYYLNSKTFKTVGAAKSALTRAAKKTGLNLEIANYFDKIYDRTDGDYNAANKATMAKFEINCYKVKTNAFICERDLIKKSDYAIAEYADFKNNIEKTRMTRNLLNPNSEEFAIPMNTPNSCDPGSETYHCM